MTEEPVKKNTIKIRVLRVRTLLALVGTLQSIFSRSMEFLRKTNQSFELAVE